MGREAKRSPRASPAQFPQISALQSSPKSTVTQLAVHDCDFLHQDHSAYSNDLISSDYYLFWSLIMMVSAIHDDEWLKPFFDAGNWFYLVLCEVINYNDVISATDSLDFVKDVHFTDV